MKPTKTIALLLLIAGQTSNAAELNEWRNNLAQIYGQEPFERKTIDEAHASLRRYQQLDNEGSAEVLYQQLLKEYNPRILDQRKRPLFNDLYAKLKDEKIERDFLTDHQSLEDEHDEAGAEKLYEFLVEKYQHLGPKKDSIESRLARLDAQMIIKRNEARARDRHAREDANHHLLYDEGDEGDDSSNDDGAELMIMPHDFPLSLNPITSDDEYDSDSP